MSCGYFVELLSARQDGELDREEELELSEHLASCPQCRALAEQLDQLQKDCRALEELEAPAGFAPNVIYALNRRTKIVPLFRRLQVGALAAAAAGFVLCAALYGTDWRSGAGQEALMDGVDSSAVEETALPQFKAARAQAPQAGLYSAQSAPADVLDQAEVLTLDSLPEGAEELLPAGGAGEEDLGGGAAVYTGLSAELLDQIQALAEGQQIAADRVGGSGEGPYILVILDS